MRRQEDRERTIVLIDVGQDSTTVVFARTGEICFVKQMVFGTSRFDADIASKLEVSVQEAQSLRLKQRNNEIADPVVRNLIVDSVHNAAEQLAAEVALCLRYYSVTFRGKRVERAIVAGGGAYEPILLEVIHAHLAIDIEVAEPLRGCNLSSLRNADALGVSADLALAVGLGLKGWRPSASPVVGSESRDEPVLEGEPV